MTHDVQYRRILYRMGYYNYQQGLIYHRLREQSGWNSHLRNCRSFIARSLYFAKPSIVTVLGSGWLLDLPLKEIAEQVRQVNLVDIIHPPDVKKQITVFPNVTLREEDISGGLIGEVWSIAGKRLFFNKLKSLDAIRIREYSPQYDPGMVISLNLLTQLESLPLRLLRKKSAIEEECFVKLRKKIQENHLNFLGKHMSLLITDISEIVTMSSGGKHEIRSVLTEIPHAMLEEEWTWHFDFSDSDYYRKKSVFKVSAKLFGKGLGNNNTNRC